MWQATIIRTERTLENISVVIVYSNGDQEFTESINIQSPEPQWLQDQINLRLNRLVNHDNIESSIKDSTVNQVSSIDSSSLEISTSNPVTISPVTDIKLNP